MNPHLKKPSGKSMNKSRKVNITKNGKLMGRKEKPFDALKFKKLCELFCTSEEIAGILGMSRGTLYKKVELEYGETFTTMYKRCYAGGVMSLRRAQAHSALTRRNVAMQIWLGQQYLGQSNRTRAVDNGEREAVTYEVLEQLLDGASPIPAPEGGSE